MKILLTLMTAAICGSAFPQTTPKAPIFGKLMETNGKVAYEIKLTATQVKDGGFNFTDGSWSTKAGAKGTIPNGYIAPMANKRWMCWLVFFDKKKQLFNLRSVVLDGGPFKGWSGSIAADETGHKYKLTLK